MDSRGRPTMYLALLTLVLCFGGSTPALAQTLNVRTDRGCGSQAVYQNGELIQIFFSSSQTVLGQLTLTRPDGTMQTLASQTLQGGVTYTITGVIGPPDGTRTLTLSAGGSSAKCTYTGGATTPPPPTPDRARVLGLLSFGDTQDPIVAPTTVGMGQQFRVTVTTFGDGCVEQGDEGVIVRDTGASIFVYDLTTATQPNVVCTTILKRFQHTVTLSFSQPGEKVIRIWGRQETAGAPALGEPVVREHRVQVQ